MSTYISLFQHHIFYHYHNHLIKQRYQRISNLSTSSEDVPNMPLLDHISACFLKTFRMSLEGFHQITTENTSANTVSESSSISTDSAHICIGIGIHQY